MTRIIIIAFAILSLIVIGCQAEPTATPAPPPPTEAPTQPPPPTDTPTATATQLPPTPLPPTPTATPTPVVITGTVKATLNVRETSSTTAKLLGTLKKGDVVNLRARTDDSKWYEINFPLDSTITAWVIASLIETNASPESIPALAQVQTPVAIPTATSIALNVTTTPTLVATNVVTGTAVVTATTTVTATIASTVTLTATPQVVSTPLPPNAAGAPPGSVIYDTFENGQFQINRVRADGTGLTTLITNASEPALSPNGTKLAYHKRNNTAGLGVAVADLNGANEVILNSASSAGYPTWSADGNNIAYHIQPSGRLSGNIFWLPALPGQQPTLVAIGVRPAWQPGSGLLVLYDGCNNGSTCDSLYTQPVFTPDLNNPTLISHGTNPAWSPNGQQIAFQDTDANGHVNIFIVNRDGLNRRQVTKDSGNTGTPIWSANAQWILYRSDQNGTGWALFAVHTDGTGVRKIVDAPVNADEWPYEKLAVGP